MTSNQDQNESAPGGRKTSGEAAAEEQEGELEIGLDQRPDDHSGDSERGSDDPDIGGDSPDEWSQMEEELAQARDRHLRLAAEFENYRKRTRQEMGQSGTRAQAALIGSLLDALDDFDRIVGMDPAGATADSLLEGVQLVERKLQRSLADAGVETIDPEGDPFDPELMEAVMREPAMSEEDDDTVSRVLQKGVMFKGHLVRPARVAVRKLD